jgi:hypothetical protein
VEVHKLEHHDSQMLQNVVDSLGKAGTDAVHADSMDGLDLVVLVVEGSSSCALAQSGHLL